MYGPFPNVESHKDVNGDLAPISLIGRHFRHAKSGKTYEVIGFTWIGDTDEWGVLHTLPGDPVYCRSLRNFNGKVDAKMRFTEVRKG